MALRVQKKALFGAFFCYSTLVNFPFSPHFSHFCGLQRPSLLKPQAHFQVAMSLDPPVQLFDTDFTNFLQIGQALEAFQDAILLEGGHTVGNGLMTDLFDLGFAFDQGLHFVGAL